MAALPRLQLDSIWQDAYAYQQQLKAAEAQRKRAAAAARERSHLEGDLDRFIAYRVQMHGRKSVTALARVAPAPNLLIDALQLHLGVAHIRTALYKEPNAVLDTPTKRIPDKRTRRAVRDARIFTLGDLLMQRHRWWPGLTPRNQFIRQIGMAQRWELWKWCVLCAYDGRVFEHWYKSIIELHASSRHFPRIGYGGIEPLWDEASLSAHYRREYEAALACAHTAHMPRRDDAYVRAVANYLLAVKPAAP